MQSGSVTENVFDESYFAQIEKTERQQRFHDEFSLIDYHLPPKAGDRILDSACGTGRLGLHLLRRYPRITLTFSDISPVASKYLSKYTFIRCPLEIMPFPDGYFDTVYCLHAVSHVVNPRSSLSELYRITRHGGHICIITPNKFYVTVLQFASFLRLIPPYKFDETVRQLYTIGSLSKLLAEVGWKVSIAKTFGPFAARFLRLDLFRWHILIIAKKPDLL